MRPAALTATVLLAALAFVAAGCGGGSSKSSLTPLELVADAATKTTKADSAKIHMAMTETLGPIGPLTITADGVSDTATHSAQMSMDLSSIAQLAGKGAGDPSQWKGDVIVDGSNGGLVEYMRLPALSKFMPGAKPWLKLDLAKLGKKQGIDFSQLLQAAGNGDPTQALQMIQSVGNVQKVGTEQVDGVDTTKYAGTIDPQKLGAKFAAAGVGKLMKELGTTPIPVSVWVDGSGYVRKVEESMSMQVPNSGTLDLKMSFELSDFGTPVNVTPPPADQTTDLSKLIPQAGK
jgi:hypothetical protein